MLRKEIFLGSFQVCSRHMEKNFFNVCGIGVKNEATIDSHPRFLLLDFQNDSSQLQIVGWKDRANTTQSSKCS